MSLYLLRASNVAGSVGPESPLPLDEALKLAVDYRDRGFQRITLTNVDTGVEITDLDRFMKDRDPDA